MISDWLTFKQRESKSGLTFDVIDYDEKSAENSKIINEDFKNILIQNTLDYDILKQLAESLGWEKTKQEFILKTIPKKKNMKKGRFGEILSSSILEEFHNYSIPIHKLQYVISTDQSLPGTDLIAIKKNDSEILEMCFVEAKVRTGYDINAISEAFEQLENDIHDGIPTMLRFVMARLAEKKDPILQLMINYHLSRRIDRDTFRIVGLYDKKHWNEKSLTNLTKITSGFRNKLVVDVIQMNDLKNKVEQFYKSIGWELDE